jgi:hypothetical protein
MNTQANPMTDAHRPTLTMKGMLGGTMVVGSTLQLWFQSPTGDSSDSQIFEMRCNDERQAKAIEAHHRKVWGLEPVA